VKRFRNPILAKPAAMPHARRAEQAQP
jgi:hypothetical protein